MKKKILTSIAICIVVGIITNIFLMYRFGRSHIIEESSNSIQQVGNNLVYRILSRMREYEAVIKSLSGVSNELWVKREDLRGAITNMLNKNQDTRIRSVYVYSEGQSEVEQWNRGEGRSWKKQVANKTDLEPNEWYHVATTLDKNVLYWNRGVLKEGSDLPTVTGIYKSEQQSGEMLVIAIDLQLNGLNAITEKLEKEIEGSYIFITDQSNQFLILSDKMNSDYRSAENELMSTEIFAKLHKKFTPIKKAFEGMTQSVLSAAMQMPSYDKSKSHEMAGDGLVSSDYTDLTVAITMDPLIRATFRDRFEMEVDFITGEASSVYSFFVPETYWKLAIIVPTSFETAVASKITRLFYIFWIGGAVLFLFAFSYFLNRFMRKPISDAEYQAKVYNNSLEKSNWNQLKELSQKEYCDSEVGLVQQQFAEFLKKVIAYHEENKREKDEIEQDLKNIQKNRDKVLDRCEDLDKENKSLQKRLEHFQEEHEGELEELGEREKDQKESFHNVVRNLKGLRMQLIPIWEEVIYIPHVVNLIGENFKTELENLAERVKKADCRYLILSLQVFPFEDKKEATKQVVELCKVLKMMGVECIFVSVPPTVAHQFASLSDTNTKYYSEQSISKALVQAWKLQDEANNAKREQVKRVS